MMKLQLLSLLILSKTAYTQINLGSFFLHPQQGGGFDMGMGQGANILGFGGDRSFNLAGNRAGFAMGSNNGAMIGGQRVGVDGGIGGGREGVEMGSQVQFGNQPQSMHPAGQFGSFLDNVKNFFSFLGRGMPMPPPPPSPPFMAANVPPRRSGGQRRPDPMLIGTEGNAGGHRPQPWFPESSQQRPTDNGPDGETAPKEGETDGGVPPSTSIESELIEPNNGETKKQPEVDFNLDKIEAEEFTDDLFTAQTDRPRQLPGLVEFA